MKTVEIRITNNRIPELKRRFPQEVQEIVDKTAFDLKKLALDSMQGSKTGRVYTRGGKSHQASAPGEGPAVDTGNLFNSIEVEKERSCVDVVAVYAEYGALLEFGTQRIASRPFITPAVKKVKGKFLQALKQLEARLA